jgi:hypothetical protein
MENKTRSFILKSSEVIMVLFIVPIVAIFQLSCLLLYFSINQTGFGFGVNYIPIYAIFCIFLCLLFSIIPTCLHLLNRAVKRYELQNKPEQALRMLRILKITLIVLVVVVILPIIFSCLVLIAYIYSWYI